MDMGVVKKHLPALELVLGSGSSLASIFRSMATTVRLVLDMSIRKIGGFA